MHEPSPPRPKSLRISVSSLPMEVMSEPSLDHLVAQSEGRGSGSCLYRRLVRVSLLHFPIVKPYLAEDREGRRWGKRRRRNVREEAGAVSDSCSLAVWPQNSYLNPEPCPTFKVGIMTVIAVLRGCDDDDLRKYVPEKCFCKCHYTVPGTERWLHTCITCMIFKKISFKRVAHIFRNRVWVGRER